MRLGRSLIAASISDHKLIMDHTTGDDYHSILDMMFDFRTITSLLEVLQDPSLTPQQRIVSLEMLIRTLNADTLPVDEQRQIIDALVILLAAGDYVVALTTKPGKPMATVACGRVGRQSGSISAPSTLNEGLEGRFLKIVMEIRL